MELDDLKSLWNDATHQGSQQHLTSESINQMTQRKLNSKIKRIAYPEIIGVIICLMAAGYIIMNFYKLDTAFLQIVGAAALFLLIALSAISVYSLQQLKFKGEASVPYTETLKQFAIQQLQFYKLQKLNITLSYILMVIVVVLLSKLVTGKDITGNNYYWIFSITIGYIFLLFYSKWVYKFYKKTVTQAKELLQELQPS